MKNRFIKLQTINKFKYITDTNFKQLVDYSNINLDNSYYKIFDNASNIANDIINGIINKVIILVGVKKCSVKVCKASALKDNIYCVEHNARNRCKNCGNLAIINKKYCNKHRPVARSIIKPINKVAILSIKKRKCNQSDCNSYVFKNYDACPKHLKTWVCPASGCYNRAILNYSCKEHSTISL
jgi:hypothetical protein